MSVTSKQGAAFVAALTAEDVLTSADHREANTLAQTARNKAREAANLAFHNAGMAKATTTLAWYSNSPEWEALGLLQARAVRNLIVSVERYMQIPARTKDGATGRKRQLAEWGKVIGGSTPEAVELWRNAERRWLAAIDAEAATFTKTREA